MRLRLIAVGTRMPAWVRAASDDYLRRLRGGLAVTLTEIEAPSRRGGRARAMAAEGTRLLGALRPADHLVALDERGTQFSTHELAHWLKQRLHAGVDLAFAIGGPDGLPHEVLARSQLTLSLSRLTLPHALARVVLAEQLYRAHCILANHPYHRD